MSHSWTKSLQHSGVNCEKVKSLMQEVYITITLLHFLYEREHDKTNKMTLCVQQKTQISHLPRLIWVFAGCTVILLVFHALAQLFPFRAFKFDFWSSCFDNKKYHFAFPASKSKTNSLVDNYRRLSITISTYVSDEVRVTYFQVPLGVYE